MAREQTDEAAKDNPKTYWSRRFSDLDWLARNEPPFGADYRKIVKRGIRLGLSCDSSDSIVGDYENSLRQHREELLEREDTIPKVREYITRHIN